MDRYISTIYSSVFLIVLTTLSINAKAQSSPSISGPACVVAGKSANYSISNLPSGSSNYKMTWCATGGKIVGAEENESCKTQTPLYSITVQWNPTNTQGSGYISFKSVDGNNAVITELSTNPTIKPVLQGGGITSAQTQSIAYYTSPSIINCSASSGGACTPLYAYQWQQSYNNVDWTEVAGKTTQNLSFTNPLFQTTYYRRKVTETTSSDIEYSSSATVFVAPPFSMMQINPSVQNIYINQVPATLTGGAASGGSCGGSYTYEWYYSTDGGVTYPVNQKISGATGTSYSPPASGVAATKYYRRKDICGSLFSYNTACVVNWYNHLTAGTISSPATTVNFYTSPGSLTTTTVSGGICSQIQYQWQTSPDDITYTNTGITAMSYNPGKLTQKLYIRCKYICDETTYSNVIIINVNPQLFPGTLVPNIISIASGTSPGQLTANPARGGNCGSYTYAWQQSSDAGFTNPATVATTQNYTPGNLAATTYYRRAVTCGTDVQYTNTCTVTIGAPASYNYVQERVITKPGIATETAAAALTGIADVKQTTQYFDGLGRPLQTVSKMVSPAGTDMVAVNTYDEYGREAVSYLPYTAATTDGKYKVSALPEWTAFNTGQFSGEQFFNSRTEFEPSQLNRPSASFAPGNSWAGANRGVTQNYYVNRTTDAVRQWSCTYSNTVGVFGTYATGGTYPEGDLAKTITTDENGKQVIEFTDKQNRTLLKKVQLTASADDGSGQSHTGWLCTYYIYDDFGNLRCVVQPGGVELLAGNSWDLANTLGADILNEQCFRYEYDRQNRMNMKKVPGAGAVYMVYDKRDRLVFTQDANMRPTNKWMYTLYDELNRPVQTGMMTYSGFPALQTYADGTTVASLTAPAENNADPVASVVTLPVREAGVSSYSASSEIRLTDGFSSEDNADFKAEIVAASPSTFTSPLAVNQNPVPAGTPLTALTYTYYDNYDWTTAAYSTADNGKVSAGSNPYAEALPAANNLKVTNGVTGTRVRIIEDAANLSVGAFMEAVTYYDEKGRVIQVQAANVTGGKDITTTLYDFSSKVLSTYINHNKKGGTSQAYAIASRMSYDAMGRLLQVEKSLNGSGTWKTVSAMTYNSLGQLKTKKLGADPNSTANPPTPLESLAYDYNIRGWLLGMNRDYAKSTGSTANYFGFDLGYDKTALSGGTGGAYAAAAYNGNITGMVWKSTGDDKVRKYDFTYDAANRLQAANFTQYNTGSSAFNILEGIDFTVNNLQYDANGNITKMWQQGWKPGGSNLIDKLSYGYVSNSNRLKTVVDEQNDPATSLGDFRSSSAYMTSLSGTKTVANAATYTDYSYDMNGNLTTDKNKDITGITYNYLNLPQVIATAKGTINFIYDAAGSKLKKIVKETGKADKTTLYLFGTYQDEVLQYLPQEEGRIRKKEDGTFTYDYFLKDHLGNVRMVLTEEQKTDAYPPASLETATINTEKLMYSIPDDANTRVNKSSVSGYPANDTYTSPNDFVHKLKGDATKVGSAILLKVMAGDKVNIHASSWWKGNGVTPNSSNTTSAVTDLATALVSSIPGISGGKVAVGGVSSGTFSPSITDLLNLRNTNNYQTTKPKAYLNWILLDEQFNEVTSTDGQNNSGFEQVGADNVFTPHNKAGVEMTKSGYVYVYVSNESTDINVYFDNLQVTQVRGPILEETHYYPFGLTMAGISSKAAGSLINKNKFNSGNELQSGEFSDGSGLELYDAKNRMYDGQIGRFGQIDPLADMSQNISSYAFGSNNPISINDPLGLQDSSHTLSPVTVTTYVKNKANQFANWFTGANVGYNGSGWGHGPRAWLGSQLGLGHNANNLWELGMQSMLQNNQVNLTGSLLNGLKTDPAMIAFRNKIIAALKADPRFRKLAFVTKGGEGVQFGGQRWGSKNENWGALNGNNPALHGETWAVGGNELTWAVRHAEVDYSATVKTDGTIVVSFHLSDRLDLSPQPGRSEAYNNISQVTGFMYHDAAGGNSEMKVNADWQTTVK